MRIWLIGWLVLGQRPFETVFQSISGCLGNILDFYQGDWGEEMNNKADLIFFSSFFIPS